MKFYIPKIVFTIFVMSMAVTACSNNEEHASGDSDISIINFYFENGRYFDVLIQADTISGEALDDPKLRFIIAKTYLEIGHPNRAQEILENLKLEGHDLEDLDLLIVEALYKQQKIKAAKDVLLSSEIQNKYANSPKLVLLQAKIELAENNVEAAKTLLLKLEEGSEEFDQGQIWLARIDLLENREAKAIKRVKKALDAGKESIDAWLLLANIKFSNEEYLEAENYYLQALKLDHSKILTQQALQIAQNVVLSKTALGNTVAGQEFYQAFLASYPKSPIYYFELARLAYAKDDFSVAEENLKEVLKTTPNNPRVVSLLAKILIKQGKLNDAGVLLQQHIANAVGGLDLVVLKAITDMEVGNHQAAIDILTNYSRENDAFHIALVPLLAHAHLKNNDVEKYTELLSAYDIGSPNSIKGINSVRTMYVEIGDFDEAESFLGELIRSYPKSDELKVLYLSTLKDIGKKEDISDKIGSWLTEQSGNTTLRLISINQAIENGSYASAITQFKKINTKNLSEREKNLLANNIKNLVFKTRGEDDQKNVFDLLVDWQKTLPDKLQLMLADIYISEAVYQKAIPLYEKILSKHQNDYVVLNNLAWSYFSVGDDRALATAEQAYASNPNDAPVCDTLGWILVKSGQAQKGLQLIQEALDIDPDNAAIKEHYQIANKQIQ